MPVILERLSLPAFDGNQSASRGSVVGGSAIAGSAAGCINSLGMGGFGLAPTEFFADIASGNRRARISFEIREPSKIAERSFLSPGLCFAIAYLLCRAGSSTVLSYGETTFFCVGKA